MAAASTNVPSTIPTTAAGAGRFERPSRLPNERPDRMGKYGGLGTIVLPKACCDTRRAGQLDLRRFAVPSRPEGATSELVRGV